MATAPKQTLKPIANSNGTFSVGNQIFKDAASAAKALARRSTAPVITKKAPVAAVNNNQPGVDTQAGTTTPNIPTIPTEGTETPVMPTAPKLGEKTTVLPISKDSDVYKKLIAKGYDDTKIMELYDKARSDRAAYEKTQKADTTAPAEVAPATPAAPVNVNVNTASPEPVAPVAQPNQGKTDANGNIIPLTPKALSEYQDNSTARQNEIVNNLNSYRQSNPEFMTSLDTFRKTFSYGLRSDDQKQLLDNWYLGYQKGIELGNMGTNAIVDQYGSGNITSSDLEQLRLNNPAKYQEAMEAINKKDIVRTYQNELYETDEQKTIMAQLDEVSGQGTIFEEYKNTINSDEVKALQSEIQDMETQREQLSLELNDIQDQVEKRYEGTGATKGKIAYIVAKESAALQKQITSLGIDSANRVDKYNSIVNTAKETMQLQLQEQEAERAARNQKMQELGFYYEYDPVGMAERAENIFNIENPDINSPDANTARRALNNELTKYYEKYGDIIIRPQSQALNDILAQAKADGTSLSAALKKNFTDQLQSKSLYGQTLGKNIGIDMGTYNMVQGKDGNRNISQKQTAGKIVNINGIDYMQDEQGNLSIPNTPYVGTTYAGSGMAGAGLRNNNPGNIKDTGFGDVLGTDGKGFAQFATPEDGFDALVAKVKNSQTNPKSAYYGKTIAQYISKYAPSSDNNNPIAYAQSVANALGVNVNTKVSDVDATKFAAAIAKHDSGYDYSTYGQFRGKTPSGNAPTAAELAYFAKGATGIDPKGKDGITQQRYNEIAKYNEANKGTAVQPLSDDQRVVYNNQLGSFRGNAVVKAFEDGMTQYSNIQSSLEDVSGPGDVAAIFQFMKSLDPTSVVRESEFQVAAASAGVVNQIGNTYNKVLKGQRLTDVQREAFGKLAKQFIINRGKSYDRLYDDFVRVTDNMGIDRTYLPTRATTQLYSTQSTTPTTPTVNYNFGGSSIGTNSRMSTLSSLVN